MSKGVYCLIIRLYKDKTIEIGKLGLTSFKKGHYCYVGSALKNLEKRIGRHKRRTKTLRWHIDYFLKYGKIVKVFQIKTEKRIECLLSERVNKISENFIKNFGCSDCRCITHLYYFRNPNKLNEMLHNYKKIINLRG